MDRPNTDIPEVFISYTGTDRGLAATLAEALAAVGVRPWWDADLRFGEPWEQRVQRVLADTKVVVVLLSAPALSSEWVRWEVSQASQNGLHIVPLLVGGVDSNQLPPPLDLLPLLRLSTDGDHGSIDDVARQVRSLIATTERAPASRTVNGARRRLASAAADVARQAADIKQRKAHGASALPIVINHTGHREEPRGAARYSTSDGLASFLHNESVALAFTSFQTDELFLVGRTASGEISVDAQAFRKPMGLCVTIHALIVATLGHVYRLENTLRPHQRLDGRYTHCYIPRLCHLTGILDTHDVAPMQDASVVFAATRYNCLATLSPVHAYRPIWRPAFISEMVAEDRCHLNGLAMRDGTPAYVTAAAPTNAYNAWRDHLSGGGIVIDVQTSEVVCDGLSMPHSPRLDRERLWVLNSGAGELGYVDLAARGAARFRAVSSSPGFVRGLAFHGDYAFVGVSCPRYDDGFRGLPLQSRFGGSGLDPWCGIQIIEKTTGRCVHWLRIHGDTRELYDVVTLPGVSCPRAVSPHDEQALDFVTIEE